MAKLTKGNEVVQKPLKKGLAQFNLVGVVKINAFTFKIDQESKTSDWIYNNLNLGVDCGNGNVVYAEMSGGYGSERQNELFVHGMKEDDNKKKVDDWDNQFKIVWEDREDEDILETVADSCFIKIGIEKKIKDKKESIYTKKFLSGYDAIAYLQQHLEDGMIVNVKGDLQYSLYNDNVQTKKIIKSIFLSKADDISKYKATFTQTMLLDKDSLGKLDKEKAIYPISVRVIDYIKMYGNKEVKQNITFNKIFELEVDKVKPENTKKFIDKFIKVKKGLNEVVFEGNIIEGQAIVTITDQDIPEDIMELIEMGAYTREEAVGKIAVGGSREKRMIIKKPLIKMVGEGEEKKPIIAKEEGKYKEEDVIFAFMLEEDETEESEDVDSEDIETLEDDEEEVDLDDNSWLDALSEDE